MDGKTYNNGSIVYTRPATVGQTIGFLLDLDSGEISYTVEGSAMAGPSHTGLSGTIFPAVGLLGSGTAVTFNFGASAFKHSPPPGYNVGLGQ